MHTSKYAADIDAIISRRHDNGADFWVSEKGSIGVGTPFSTLESLLMLHELGIDSRHEVVAGALGAVLDNWREDGRIRVSPSGSIYPCHTANAARVLCRFGLLEDERLQHTLEHLLEIQHDDGGWRCLKFSGGRGPRAEFSNPGVTLFVLDAFRQSDRYATHPALARAVDSLLGHRDVRKPIGPCHFGMGSLFMQVEYPFLRYNLFYYCFVLSFYEAAHRDERFQQPLAELAAKLDDEGRMVVERPHRGVANLNFCRKGKPSEAATRRYREILGNLE